MLCIEGRTLPPAPPLEAFTLGELVRGVVRTPHHDAHRPAGVRGMVRTGLGAVELHVIPLKGQAPGQPRWERCGRGPGQLHPGDQAVVDAFKRMLSARRTPAPWTEGAGSTPADDQRDAHATPSLEREGAHRPVPRGHAEEIAVDGETEPVVVRLDGVEIEHPREVGQAHPGAAGGVAGSWPRSGDPEDSRGNGVVPGRCHARRPGTGVVTRGAYRTAYLTST